MNSDRFFLIANPVDDHLTIRITRCEVCHQIYPTHCIVHKENDKIGVLLVCENCYQELELFQLEPKKDAKEETILIKDASSLDNKTEESVSLSTETSDEPNIVMEGDEIIIKEESPANEGIELEKEVNTLISQEKEGSTEDLLKQFIQYSLTGKDPYELLDSLGAFTQERVSETILMLEALSSYPFPSARLKAVETLARLLKNSKGEIKQRIKQAITVFANDTDPAVKDIVKKLT